MQMTLPVGDSRQFLKFLSVSTSFHRQIETL